MSEEMDWNDLLAAGNSRLYYMPYVYLPDLISLRKAYNLSIAELAASRSAILIDGEGEIPSNSIFYKDTAHFTAMGSEAMSARVIKRLLSNAQLIDLLAKKGCQVI